MNRNDQSYMEAVEAMLKMADSPEEFKKYIDSMVLGNYKYPVEWEFLGFIEDYYHLSRIIPLDTVVVDVGCANGFQHTFFRNHVRYIGIEEDQNNATMGFTKNSEFWKMKFLNSERAIEQLKIEYKKVFGIDNMSLHYSIGNAEDIALFDRIF
jgi:hypothetical protein